MQCVIPSQNVRILVRGLHSLSRIGDDLYVEPTDECLSFRTVNSAQSAYSSLVFNLPFFTQYKCEFNTEEAGKCKLSVKACLAVFKTPHCMDRNVDSCMIEIDKECIKLSFQIYFIQGYTKNYFLSVTDNENVQLKYNRDEMCNRMSILSKTLNGAIKHFRANDEEITLSVTADKARLKNYFENTEVNNQKVVRTNLSLQRSEFEMYEIKQPGSITFALRELRAVCTFSELSNSSPVGIFFGAAGKPVIFTIRNNSIYEADYVVSTLPVDMISGERPLRKSQLSDVVSTLPSTSSANVNKRRKLAPVAEESETNTPTANARDRRETTSARKSNSGNVNFAFVPRVSLVDIIKYNDEQKSCPRTSVDEKSRTPEPIQNSCPPESTENSCPLSQVQNARISKSMRNNVPDFFSDDINNDSLQMICEQVDEITRTQMDRINTVFKYCFNYSPSSALPETGDILCDTSDTGVD